MRKPFVKYPSAEETSAFFYRARKSPRSLRSEGKLLIALTVVACICGIVLYKALFSA